MSLAVVNPAANRTASPAPFIVACLGVIALAAILAGAAPIWFSIATVFLFAGPHNWFEARYMLGRMPARWRPFGGYYLFGIAGVVILSAIIAALPYLPLDYDAWLLFIAAWNAALIAWVATLAVLRTQQRPRRDWPWVIPVALVLIGLNWLQPLTFFLGMVYAHPLMALAFLDREIARRKPAWKIAYRGCLLCVPVAMLALTFALAGRPNLLGNDLTEQITRHAGGTILTGVSNHLLVALHTFLEMLHYGVWLVALPLLATKALPWQVDRAPLAAKGPRWKAAVLAAVALGGVVLLMLWGAFLFDYPTTRNVYFTIAMLHVLAEAPFLIRLL